MNKKLKRGFKLIGEGMAESPSLLHLALVYDKDTDDIFPMVHTFEDIELLKKVLRVTLARVESGAHERERMDVTKL